MILTSTMWQRRCHPPLAVILGASCPDPIQAREVAVEVGSVLADAAESNVIVYPTVDCWYVLGVGTFASSSFAASDYMVTSATGALLWDGWTEIPLPRAPSEDLDGKASRINGDWCSAHIDAKSGTCTLRRALGGLRPMYYTRGAHGELVWCSTLIHLLRTRYKPRRLTVQYLADYAGPGFLVRSALTPYHEVFRLRPGHCLAWSSKETEVRQRPLAPLSDMAPAPRAADPASALRTVIDGAVLRRVRGTRSPVLWVSGGLDSSAILCSWLSLRERGEAVPAPLLRHRHFAREGDEMEYIRCLERHFGITCFVDDIAQEEWLFKDFENAPSVTEPHGALLGGLGLRRLEYEAQHPSVELAGYMGDELFVSDMALLADDVRKGDIRAFRQHMAIGLRDGWGAAHLVGRHVVGPIVFHAADVGRVQGVWSRWLSSAFRRRTGYRERLRERVRLPVSSTYESARRLWRSMYGLTLYESTGRSDVRSPLADVEVVRCAVSLAPQVVGLPGDDKKVLRAAFPDMPECVRARHDKAVHDSYSYEGIKREWMAIARKLRRLAVVEIGMCRHKACLADLLSLRLGQVVDVNEVMRLLTLELFLQQKLFVEGWDIA